MAIDYWPDCFKGKRSIKYIVPKQQTTAVATTATAITAATVNIYLESISKPTHAVGGSGADATR